MILYFLLPVLMALCGLRRADNNERDYMSVNMTNSIKGFFLRMVFLSHIWSYTDFSYPLDHMYQKLIREKTGQCIVTMFLFYSGYGIMEAIKRKGQAYIDKIPVRRFLNVLLQFDCAILLFLLYRYVTGERYGLKKLLLTFVGWDGIGNSNWYIFCILWVYIFLFISFKVFKNCHLKAVFGTFVLSLLYMAAMCKLGRDHWWYDTILCCSWGILFSLYRAKIEQVICESRGSWFYFMGVFTIGYIVSFYYRNTSQMIYQIWVFCFVAAIVTFTMRYVVDSAILRRGGAHLFELYILQRLPMMILKPYMLTEYASVWQKYMYVAVCLAATVVLAVLYDMTIGKGIKYLISRLSDH